MAHDLQIVVMADVCMVVQRVEERAVPGTRRRVQVTRFIAWCTDTDDALAYIAEREALRAGGT